MTIDKLRGRLIISLVLGAMVGIALTAYADFGKVIDALGEFRWGYMPFVLLLTSMNYALRFLKWQYYLHIIGVREFRTSDSALTYLSGLGMVVTPGKVGEWLKCFLLRELQGTSFSRSAPIVVAERLTDSLGLVILGAAGLIVFRDSWPVFVIIVAGCGGLVVVARNKSLSHWILQRLERLPLVGRFAHQAEDFYDSSYALLGPVPLGAMTLLSVVSWGFEVLAFYVVLLGTGQEASIDLLLKASFIMPVATLASALLMTPGGLGVAEASIAALCIRLLHMSEADSTVATLIIRFGTLWFGVIVGLVALVLVSRRLSGAARGRLETMAVEPP